VPGRSEARTVGRRAETGVSLPEPMPRPPDSPPTPPTRAGPPPSFSRLLGTVAPRARVRAPAADLPRPFLDGTHPTRSRSRHPRTMPRPLHGAISAPPHPRHAPGPWRSRARTSSRSVGPCPAAREFPTRSQVGMPPFRFRPAVPCAPRTPSLSLGAVRRSSICSRGCRRLRPSRACRRAMRGAPW